MTPRQRFLAARLAYVAIVLIATLTELDFSWNPDAVAERLQRALMPSLRWSDAIDGLRNVALFAGLGAVWVVTSFSGRVRAEIVQAVQVGLWLSATVEGLQLFSPVRTSSLLDVATNTVGAAAGAITVALLIAEVTRARGGRSYLGMPTILVAGAYGLSVLCEAVTPLFRAQLMAGLSGGPLARLHTALRWAGAPSLSLSDVPVLDILLFAPAGFFGVIALAERGRAPRATWLVVAAGGAAVACVAELAHGVVGIAIRWDAAATHALALGVGAWAARHSLAQLTQELRGAVRARAMILAYMGLLVLWGWRPFFPQLDGSVIAAQFTAVHLVPLRSLFERVDVFSALHVTQQFLLYLPLGSLLAVWPLRSSGPWSHLRPALWLAAMIEAGHVLIVDRYFDVTNALIAVAGIAIGWVVMRRSGYVPYGEAMAAVPR